MLRAQLKDKAYFDSAVAFNYKAIKKIAYIDFDSNMTTQMGLSILLFNRYLTSLYLRYSRGDAITDMRNDVEQVLQHRKLQKYYADRLPNQDERRQYETMTTGRLKSTYRWLSFALAVGVDEAYIQDVLGLIGLAGKDKLLDLVAIKLGEQQRPISHKLWDSSAYRKLLNVIELPKEKQGKMMTRYLNRWYEVCGYKNWHLADNPIYRGYWCCEAALITRLFNLDDREYRDHPFYPKDLV